MESEYLLFLEDIFCNSHKLVAEDNLLADCNSEEGFLDSDCSWFEQDWEDQLLLVVQLELFTLEDQFE